jgi:hypothetical protein
MKKTLFTFALLATTASAATFSAIETAFIENYPLDQNLIQNRDQIQIDLEAAHGAYWPRLSLAQALNWQNYQTASLQASTSLSWDLLNIKRNYQLRSVELDQTLNTLDINHNKSQALSNLRTYIQALNTYEIGVNALQTLETDLRKARPHWSPDTSSNRFAPNEIEPYLKFLEFIDTRKSLELQAQRIRKQIGKWTKIAVEELAAGRIQYPGDVVLPPFDQNQCVTESITVKRASLRLEQEQLFEAMRYDATPTLTLNASGSYTSTPTTGQPNLSGVVSLQAAFNLPPNAPGTFGVQVAATPNGLTQTASASFPNPFRSADPQGVKWAAKNLEEAREVVQTDLEELLRTRQTSLETLRLDKQRLEWSERNYKDTATADELVRIGARLALMGLKVRSVYDHLSYQINGLNVAQLCQLQFTYGARDPLFDVPKNTK